MKSCPRCNQTNEKITANKLQIIFSIHFVDRLLCARIVAFNVNGWKQNHDEVTSCEFKLTEQRPKANRCVKLTNIYNSRAKYMVKRNANRNIHIYGLKPFTMNTLSIFFYLAP